MHQMNSINNRSHILALLFFTLICGILSAQSVTLKELSLKNQKLFKEANLQYANGNTAKSIGIYKKLLKKSPNFIEGHLRLGTIYYNQKNYIESEKIIANAIATDPSYHPEMYYTYALVLKERKNYAKAADMLSIYVVDSLAHPEKIKHATKLISNWKFLTAAMNNPKPFVPMNPGRGINTEMNEYSPVISLDNTHMIFTRNVKLHNEFIGQEDMFHAVKEDEIWTTALPIKELNTSGNEGAFAIAGNNTILVYTACDRKEGFGSCDLYYSTFNGKKWSTPINMGHTVNSATWDSQPTLSADGRRLIFSSKRVGGFGGSDLWGTHRLSNNAWAIPYNLGPQINTSEDEETPFLHANGKTLYFRSKGHQGMGGFDIFMSEFIDTTSLWTTPVNLGYPINTEGDEGSLSISFDGETGWYATDAYTKDSKNGRNLDIMYFEMPIDIRPVPVVLLYGKIKDAKSGEPISAKINVANIKTNHVEYAFMADHLGRFIIPITLDKYFRFNIEHEEYLFLSEQVYIPKIDKDTTYFIELLMTKSESLKDSFSFVLKNVLFESGSSELLATSYSEINMMVEYLLENLNFKLHIIGHTDNIGSASDNLKLSQNRAKAVYDALMKRGIEANRLSYEGKGESTPIAPNDTTEGRSKNRRTEVVLRVD